jgi:hypothetical protein
MNPRVKKLAEKIREQANIPAEEEFGSFIAVLMIISIIIGLIRVLQECNKSKTCNFGAKDAADFYGSEIRMFSMKRGYFTKMRIKKIMRQKMSKDQYAKYSMSLLNAILDTGENLGQEDTYSLMEAANV